MNQQGNLFDPGAAMADHTSKLADQLFNAESTRQPIEPLTELFPDLSLEDAYQIQRINVERRIRSGEKIVGHKIGLTARAMQELFGVNEPDYGHLLDTMIHPANTPLDMGKLIDPQIEIEPAFVLGKPLVGSPDLTIDDVIAATDYISVCFEVIDSRIKGWRIKLQDTVADNGSSSRIILGPGKIKPSGLILENLDTVLEVDGAIVESGNTGAILGHPAKGIIWLANKIGEYGIVLEAGHIVLPGTCTRSYRISKHTHVRGQIESLGELSIELESKPAIVNTT